MNGIRLISITLGCSIIFLAGCALRPPLNGLVHCEDYEKLGGRKFDEVFVDGQVNSVDGAVTYTGKSGREGYAINYRLYYDVDAQVSATLCRYGGPEMYTNLSGKRVPFNTGKGGYAKLEMVFPPLGENRGTRRVTVVGGKWCVRCKPMTVVDQFSVTDEDTGQVVVIVKNGLEAIRPDLEKFGLRMYPGFIQLEEFKGFKIAGASGVVSDSPGWAKEFKVRPKRLRFDLVLRTNRTFTLKPHDDWKVEEFYPVGHSVDDWPLSLESRISVTETAHTLGLDDYFYPKWNLFER